MKLKKILKKIVKYLDSCETNSNQKTNHKKSIGRKAEPPPPPKARIIKEGTKPELPPNYKKV
jgi:hypothetical protein